MTVAAPNSERYAPPAPTDEALVHVAMPKSPAELVATAEQKRERARAALIVGVSLGALGVFVAFARAIRSPRANALDVTLLRALARRRNRLLNGSMRDVTALGGPVLVPLAAVIGATMSRRSPLDVAQITVGSLGGVAAELGIKSRFARPRPAVVPQLDEVTNYSFPSGHAIASACLFLTLGYVASRHFEHRGTRVAVLGAAGTLAAAVGATRVYLGVHYPTDVIGGLALGVAWSSLLEASFNYAGARALDAYHRRALLRRNGTSTTGQRLELGAAGGST